MDSKTCRLKVLALAGTMFVVLLLTVQFVASCNRGSMPTLTGGAYDSVAGDGDARTTSSIQAPGGEFVFEPLDGDGSPDKRGPAAYHLTISEDTSERIAITVEAKHGFDWKYVLGYMYYNGDKYNPVDFIAGEIFGEDGSQLLEAVFFSHKGKVIFWFGMVNFDEKEPKHGGVIGTFVFNKEPWSPPKGASKAPEGSDPPAISNKVDNLERRDYQLLPYIIWSEVNRGDGDIDGWVQVADLTPVAFNWGASRPNPSEEWNLEVVDYYGNWVIGQDDADMINYPWYLTSVGGYRIEAYEDAQGINLICDVYVDGPDYGQREDIANLPCSKDLGLPGTPNWYHSKTGQVGYRYWNSEFGEYFDIWVRLTPFDQEPEKNEGVSTDLILVPLRGPQRPEASFTANPKIGNAPLSVCFDARTSSDPDGYITKYSWDWDGDGTFDETFEEPDLPDDPIWWHEYTEPGLYEPSLKVEDNDSLTDELTRPYEIDVRDPATTNLIFFNAWRYNHHDPQLEDNFGLDVMQYMEQKVDDVTGEPYWAGRKGITLQVHVQDTVNDFCNLNGARIYIDMHEPEGMSEPMRVQHVFTDPLIIPYDGCWAPDDPIFQKWRYNSQSHEWETTGIELWLYRLGGFLDSHHLYHDAEYGQDDFAGLVVSPIWIQIDMLNPQFQWFDIGINYLGATTQTPPQDGAERIFALFFPLNEQIPAACDGMTVWFIMESPVGSPRCFFSDLASDDWNFNGIEDHFTVDFSLSEL